MFNRKKVYSVNYCGSDSKAIKGIVDIYIRKYAVAYDNIKFECTKKQFKEIETAVKEAGYEFLENKKRSYFLRRV